MNYEGLTTLRADIAALANRMCDIRAEMNALEAACRFDSENLAERLACQTVFRANTLYMQAYNEILELDACFKD